MNSFDHEKAMLGLTTLSLTSTLGDSLVMLSEFLGREDTNWLDEFEAEAIKDLKNANIEGVSLEMDRKITEEALARLKYAFGLARTRIIDAAKGG